MMVLRITARQQSTQRFITRLSLCDEHQQRRLDRRIEILDPNVTSDDRFDPSRGRGFVEFNQAKKVVEIAGCNGGHAAGARGIN